MNYTRKNTASILTLVRLHLVYDFDEALTLHFLIFSDLRSANSVQLLIPDDSHHQFHNQK
jgi:hypothetical protein